MSAWVHLVPLLNALMSSPIVVYIYEVNFSSVVRQKSEIDYAGTRSYRIGMTLPLTRW